MIPYPALLPKENIDYPGSSSLKINEKTLKLKFYYLHFLSLKKLNFDL